ncbi:MAG TPA: hypothetical protein DCR06_12010, partial [Planctomycetaceae bacterium]|nr:hypothetical protein [Planctomycetaceae bacterium]
AAAFAEHCRADSVAILHPRSLQTANRPQLRTHLAEYRCAHKNQTLTPDDPFRNETIELHQRHQIVQSVLELTRSNASSFFGLKYADPSSAPVAGSS